ncbi:cytochrome P450 93A3-like protein [Tanacetum coccineum]
MWALNRDPNHWEKPHEFRSERFMDNMLNARGQHFHFLPFGTGRRKCPAISLAFRIRTICSRSEEVFQHITVIALLVVHTTLGGMIQCFDWKSGKDGNLTSVDMEPKLWLMLMKASLLVCLSVARLDPLPI